EPFKVPLVKGDLGGSSLIREVLASIWEAIDSEKVLALNKQQFPNAIPLAPTSSSPAKLSNEQWSDAPPYLLIPYCSFLIFYN
ncbi:MAG TPA: hypothetical protein V6C57_02130, partial [Coleofasciculaceae cyanobacterium]